MNTSLNTSMTKIKKNFKKLIVKSTEPINSAIKKLEKNDKKVLFIADNYKLLGVFQDSDLRRALVKKNLNDKIIAISNNKPKFIFKQNLNKVDTKKIFQSNLNYIAIPILDQKKRIVDVLFNKNTAIDTKKKQDTKLTALIMAGGLGKDLCLLH